MKRYLPLFALLLVPAFLVARPDGSKDDGKPAEKSLPEKAPADPNVEVELPESVFGDASDYAGKLEVDGKDFSGPGTKRLLKVAPEKGKDTVKVVYTFWPYAYSKTVRTKVVKLEKDKIVKVSLLKEDKETPDKIFPIFVPTPQEVVEEMCKLAKITKGDTACDIGCGDGRLVITAVKSYGAKGGIGYDINEDLIKGCKLQAKKDKVNDKVRFLVKDALTIKDFSDSSVVFLYVGEDLGKALEPTLKKTLKPGSHIVSHRFLLGDWAPDKTVEVKAMSLAGFEATYTLHLWTVKGKAKE